MDSVHQVSLSLWSEDDFPLLVAANTPAMTAHLGGPETSEQLRIRHTKYLRLIADGEARMFSVQGDGSPVGSIGWWNTEWDSYPVQEAGWFTAPSAQGGGVASRALALLIEDVTRFGTRDRLYAFPDRDNVPSNALCARLGFVLEGPARAEHFRAATLHVNPWYLPLDRTGSGRSAR